MTPYHTIHKIEALADRLHLVVDGIEFSLPWSTISRRLATANFTERQRFEVSPAGYGIHWPLLDEDLSIDCLIGIPHEIPPALWTKKAA